jgi:hypothetical protein
MIMRIPHIAGVAAVALLMLPATASATTASVDSGALNVKGGTGEQNEIQLAQQGSTITVRDERAPVTPGAGCTAGGDPNKVTCAGVVSATVELGNGDDTFSLAGDSFSLPVTVAGGDGADTIFTAAVDVPGRLFDQGTDTVTCGRGEDIVFAGGDATDPSCEVVVGVGGGEEEGDKPFAAYGSQHADGIELPDGWSPAYISAGAGSDTVYTNDFDAVVAGSGSDRIIGFDRAGLHIYGDAGNDRIDVRDKSKKNRSIKDQVHCGPGKDKVYADKNDLVAKDCERVKRR